MSSSIGQSSVLQSDLEVWQEGQTVSSGSSRGLPFSAAGFNHHTCFELCNVYELQSISWKLSLLIPFCRCENGKAEKLSNSIQALWAGVRLEPRHT
jgi:hypothetical protein